MESTDELLAIGVFARRVGLTPSALRFYDDCRVLRPAHVDPATGYRSYSTAQEPGARLLRDLREADLPLADVCAVLDGPAAGAREVLERHRASLRGRTRTADATIAAVLRSLAGGSGGPARSLVRVAGAELASAARQVAPAAGDDPHHPELDCVLVAYDEEEIRLVATDRYRFSMRVLGHAGPAEGAPGEFLIGADDLVGLGAWAARSAEVALVNGPDGVHARSAGETRPVPVRQGRFPDYRAMLAALAVPAHRLIVDRAALLAAVRERDDAPGVALRLGTDELVVALPDGARATALPAVRQDTPPLTIGFDPSVLAPALETGVGPDVLLEIAAADLPVVVRSADQGSFTTLVMPIALTPGP
ncbi:MerR family transcriptional regulator [uncultured Streptomyces sp.]|uniref:MerR family transcriptional regulator n=1 Tax=uncultured Streptomyces sp. TaxID=174707 RepID=UPI00260752BE|nr:MerR family transcriptional regulator [uncultured Streptomyces sp.]